MNVLFVVPWDNIGGVSHVLNRVAEHTRSQGHGVYFLLPGASNTPVETTSRLGFPTFLLNLRAPWVPERSFRSRAAFVLTLPIVLFRLAGLCRRLRIDVVNVHYPVGNNIYFAILRRMGITRLVTSIHGADMLPNGSRGTSHEGAIIGLLAASDVVVAPSDSYHRAVRAAWPEISAPMRTIPNGVDPTELDYQPGVDETEDPPFVFSILQMVHYKGVDVLIRAFASIAADYPCLRLRLASDGPQRQDFEALAQSLGVGDRVEFLGFQHRRDVSSLLRRCTVFVLPSRTNSESFGIAAAEAMAVDRAVVASRIGGLPELIEDGVSGLLTPPGDIDALAAALRRLLDDAELRRSVGRAAGSRVREKFLWDRTCTLYEELFGSLTASRGDARLQPQVAVTASSGQRQAAPLVDRPTATPAESAVPLTPIGPTEERW